MNSRSNQAGHTEAPEPAHHYVSKIFLHPKGRPHTDVRNGEKWVGADAAEALLQDAMIVASALDAGCTTLWSEDMHHGLSVEGRLQILNPFHPGPWRPGQNG